MITRILSFACVVSLAVPVSWGKEDWWKSMGPPEESEYRGGHVDNREKLDSEMLKFLGTQTFEEWETHEDDLVKISYPKHPLLKLEVEGGDNDGIKVEGGVCTSVDNSFQRAYVLKAGDATYGVFLLKKASWLDDGICLCGPMVHHVYRVEDGCLARFSLLPGGAVKKAQLLGDKVRLMAFEWTHLACPRPVYEEMVERMTLKIPSLWNEERLKGEVIRRYGMEGRAGWLHSGQDLATADSIMGGPSTEKDGNHVWTGIQDNYPAKVETVFENGRLTRLGSQGLQRTGEEAVRGSIDWAEDRLEKLTEEPEGKEKAAPAQADVDELVEAALSLCKIQPDAEWSRCVFLLERLASELKVRDPRLTETVLKRGKGGTFELEVLESQGYPETAAWAISHLQRMSTETPSKDDKASAWDDPVSDQAANAAALISHLSQKEHPQADDLARSLFRTGEEAWLLASIKSSGDVSPELAQEIIRESMKLAIKRESGSMIEEIFDQFTSLDLPRPEEIIALVDELPAGAAESRWEQGRVEARKRLEKMKENSGAD